MEEKPVLQGKGRVVPFWRTGFFCCIYLYPAASTSFDKTL